MSRKTTYVYESGANRVGVLAHVPTGTVSVWSESFRVTRQDPEGRWVNTDLVQFPTRIAAQVIQALAAQFEDAPETGTDPGPEGDNG
jgi:hypothetical protein